MDEVVHREDVGATVVSFDGEPTQRDGLQQSPAVGCVEFFDCRRRCAGRHSARPVSAAMRRDRRRWRSLALMTWSFPDCDLSEVRSVDDGQGRRSREPRLGSALRVDRCAPPVLAERTVAVLGLPLTAVDGGHRGRTRVTFVSRRAAHRARGGDLVSGGAERARHASPGATPRLAARHPGGHGAERSHARSPKHRGGRDRAGRRTVRGDGRHQSRSATRSSSSCMSD